MIALHNIEPAKCDMKTVIKATGICFQDKSVFTMNILQRLIVKQVWKQKMLWEGFIKCCERTKPQSFRVLLQVPPPQLRLLLDSAVELREPLLEHVQGLTEAQRLHVPSQVMEVLYNVPPKESDAEEVGEGIQST